MRNQKTYSSVNHWVSSCRRFFDLITNFYSIYNVRLTNRREIAENSIAVWFERPHSFSFEAEQYVLLTALNSEKVDIHGKSRYLSLASAPSEKELMVTVRLRDTTFKQHLAFSPIGTEYKIEGPLGSFTLPNNPEQSVV